MERSRQAIPSDSGLSKTNPQLRALEAIIIGLVPISSKTGRFQGYGTMSCSVVPSPAKYLSTAQLDISIDDSAMREGPKRAGMPG